MSHNLTTLAEDLEAIGLLPKRDLRLVAPTARVIDEAKKAKAKAEDCDDDEEMDDDDEEMDDDDMEDVEVDAEGNPIDEAMRIRKRFARTASGAYKLTRTKKTSAADRLKGKKMRRSAAGKKSVRKRIRKMKTSKAKRFATKLAAKHHESTGGMGRVANLLDDVQRVLKGKTVTESLDTDTRKKVSHAFAQLALTADTLATKFESLEDSDLDEVRDELLADLREMAEDYGDAALKIRDGQIDESEDNLSLAFDEDVRDLLHYLEIYDDCSAGND